MNHVSAADSAVAYHDYLAENWEQRYQKRAFKARMDVLRRSLQGRQLTNTFWLDAGCGTGTLSRWMATQGYRVLGIDAAGEMIARARELAHASQLADRLRFSTTNSISALKFENNSFDGVLCSSVLEYVAEPEACVAEFARVLRPAGLLLVSIPNRRSAARRMQVFSHRIARRSRMKGVDFLNYSRNEYARHEFAGLLAEAGFAVEKVLPFGGPLPSLAVRSRHWAPLMMFVAVKARQIPRQC